MSLHHSTCVIFNPNAGTCEPEALQEAVNGAALWPTGGPGDASKLVRRARKEGFRTVVAAGGDGTLNEVVNGVMEHGNGLVVGLLPLGTGNDFARTLGMPSELEEALEVLGRADVRDVDAVQVRVGDVSRYFVNVAVGGVVDKIDEKMTDDIKEFWGPLAYLRATAEALPELITHSVVVTIDGERLELEVHNVVAANGKAVGGGLPVAVRARADDGFLDCLLVSAVSGLEMATLGAKVMAGRHLDEPDERLVFRQARQMAVESDPPLTFHLDGETVEGPEVHFEIVPAALRMIVGPGWDELDDREEA